MPSWRTTSPVTGSDGQHEYRGIRIVAVSPHATAAHRDTIAITDDYAFLSPIVVDPIHGHSAVGRNEDFSSRMATHPGATGWRDPHPILVAEEKQSAGSAKVASFASKDGFPLLICAPRMTTDISRDTSVAVDRNVLPVRPRPHFATAEPANTPLDLKRGRVFKRDVADIRFAIVRIINAPGPLPRALRSHADEKLQPNNRAFCESCIWIFVVNLRFSSRAIYW